MTKKSNRELRNAHNGLSNRAQRTIDHTQPMADGTEARVSRRYGHSVPRKTWASEVTVRYIEPRQRLSREELRERELYGSVVRMSFETKRAFR